MCKKILLVLFCIFLTACESREGWGVLLWSVEDPHIPSGTVLPVYIRSNINRVWVVGVPNSSGNEKIEIPFPRLELVGSRRRAYERAEVFSPFARIYAENLQDGLPIRDAPDNNSRRVYRLRQGEMVKILSESTRGVQAIGTTGEPLPGQWYRVLTEDGTIGYTFSYRLRLFEFDGNFSTAVVTIYEDFDDPVLDTLLSRVWSHESYLAMTNSRRINLEDISRRWHFDPGAETGTARVFAPGIDRRFTHTGIRQTSERAWNFEGTNLTMNLRSETTLAVQFLEPGGGMRTVLFAALPVRVDDLITQEIARRERLINTIYSEGPVFTSNNFGTITFTETGTFTWTGFDPLVPGFIPQNTASSGTILMNLFLSGALQNNYAGAFTLNFAGGNTVLRFLYTIDEQGLRLEIVPSSNLQGNIVARRDSTPMVLFFFRDNW